MIHRIGFLVFVLALCGVGFGQDCDNGFCPLKRVVGTVVESQVVQAVATRIDHVLHPFESIRDRCDYQSTEAVAVQSNSVHPFLYADRPKATCVAQSVRRYASWPVRALRCRR